MIETFYEQIVTFGKLIEHTLEYDRFKYNDTKITVYLQQGKPISIIVSK